MIRTSDPIKMVQVTCYNCGITFALPFEYAKSHKEHDKPFCCPNGHSQKFLRPERVDTTDITDKTVSNEPMTMWPEGQVNE